MIMIDQAFIDVEGRNRFNEILSFYLQMIGGLKPDHVLNLI